MPPMRGFGMMKGPNLEILGTELVYFVLIGVLCLIVYLKTREAYRLTKHRGIFHFRNIFLYFGLAYLFRLVHVVTRLPPDIFPFFVPRFVLMISLAVVGYFSTMALLSVFMTIVGKRVKGDVGVHSLLMHVVTFGFTIVLFVTRSQPLLMFVNLFVGVLCVVGLIGFRFFGREKNRLQSTNVVTYGLLLLFWILNIVSFSPHLVGRFLRLPLYLLSVGVFFWIYTRVMQRLGSHVKKARST